MCDVIIFPLIASSISIIEIASLVFYNSSPCGSFVAWPIKIALAAPQYASIIFMRKLGLESQVTKLTDELCVECTKMSMLAFSSVSVTKMASKVTKYLLI